MKDKNDAEFPSNTDRAAIEALWQTAVDSGAIGNYDLIVFVPLTGDPSVDPHMEDDGIRSVQHFYRDWVDRAFKTLYREALPRRIRNLQAGFSQKLKFPKVVEITGGREERVAKLERVLQEMENFQN